MYARTNIYYNEQGSRNNYVRSSLPHSNDDHEKLFVEPHMCIYVYIYIYTYTLHSLRQLTSEN